MTFPLFLAIVGLLDTAVIAVWCAIAPIHVYRVDPEPTPHLATV